MKTIKAILPLLVLLSCSSPVYCADYEGRIRFGAILILTGSGSEQGINSQRAATLAMEKINSSGGINGKKLEILFEDEEGPNPKQAVSAFHKLTKVNGVRYIIGPQWQNEALAVDPLAAKSGVLLVLPSTCGTSLSQNSICIWASPESQMKIYAQYVFNRNRSLVTFSSTESWETETKDAFVKYFKQLGGRVVREIQTDQSATDIRTEAALVKKENPEAIFSSTAIHFGVFRKTLALLKVDVPFYHVELFQELINASGPEAAADVISISPVLPTGNFAKEFELRFGAPPDVPAAQAYDAVQMLAAAIRSQGDDVTRVKSYFQNFGEFTGVQGIIRSNSGTFSIPLGIYQVKNGKQILLESH